MLEPRMNANEHQSGMGIVLPSRRFALFAQEVVNGDQSPNIE